ncbi:penicillin-binding protein 2 [Kordiimonas aestuarii]|uniref:penicillin-binding protein 2 n=1 Tax=Kordiimonas aestuarii TaxID=1005925 RepID=UPI0021CFFAE1|nr:penicillin-binding protein 2 [Kordiimonas aestuarii]
MAREGLRYQTFSRRAFLLAGAQGLAVTALGGRLYYLSVVEGEKYKLRAERNRVAIRLIAPERGEILDRYGRKLATNRQDFRVFLIPEQADEVANTLVKIGHIVKLDDRRLSRIERQIKRQRKFVPVTVAQGLDWATFAKVNVAVPELPGVVPDAGRSRFYPSGNEIAHLVGYTASPNEDDVALNPLYQLPGFKVGRQGLERRYEDRLRGSAGTRRVEVNSVGREIRELPPRQEADPGSNLQLTIDLALQKYTIDLLGEKAAGVVAMDIRTGEILTMASAPTYDPNEFTRGISSENWNALLKDPRKPLINKCVTGQYPPGSTIKPVIALAALEHGVVKPETEYYCNGRHRLGNHTFNCWKPGGHGRLDLLGAIAHSCDVYFYKVAEDLDVDNIADMVSRFGLGDLFDLGIDGEKAGMVPDRGWKRAVLNQPWHLGETLNISIGQGAMLSTPLQLAVLTSRLASGRRIFPSLVSLPGTDESKMKAFDAMDVNPLHLRVARRGMEMVTERGGTAHDYRRPKSAAKLAGKSGTAQVRRISKEERLEGVIHNDDLPWNMRDHALFIAYGPVEDPEIAVSVLVQHGGGGSSVAAPIARAVIDKALEIRHAPPAEETAPDAAGTTAEEA